jgi:hypothetical protein
MRMKERSSREEVVGEVARREKGRERTGQEKKEDGKRKRERERESS